MNVGQTRSRAIHCDVIMTSQITNVALFTYLGTRILLPPGGAVFLKSRLKYPYVWSQGCPRAQKMEHPFLKGVTRVHYTLKKYLILKGKSND